MGKRKVCGYVRVSGQAQAKDGESLGVQRSEITRFCEGKGWELATIFADEGISGGTAAARPQFTQMMAEAEQGKFNGIVFARLSRFARNAREFLQFRDMLEAKTVNLYSIKEGIDPSTNTGRLMMGLMALIAEWEKEAIRENMAENRQVRWQENRCFMGKPPFGYTWNKEQKRLEVNTEEAEVYKRIVGMYLDVGLSFKDIAIRLRKEQIRCKRSFFSSETLSYLLKNPCYYGKYVVNQHEYVFSNEQGRWKRSGNMKPASEWIPFDCPVLISKPQWDRIQAKIEANKVKSKRSDAVGEYWLRDILECGHCGGSVKPRYGQKRKDGTFPAYYTCYWAVASPKVLENSTSRKTKCPMSYIPTEQIEKAVWNRLIAPLMVKPEKLASAVDPARYDERIGLVEESITRFQIDLAKIPKQRDRLLVLFEDADFDQDILKERLAKKKDEQATLEGNIAEARQEIAVLEETKQNDSLWRQFLFDKKTILRKLLKELQTLEPADKKKFAEAMIEGKVLIEFERDDDGKVQIYAPVFKRRLNTAIFEEFIREGKLGNFAVVSPDSPDLITCVLKRLYSVSFDSAEKTG